MSLGSKKGGCLYPLKSLEAIGRRAFQGVKTDFSLFLPIIFEIFMVNSI